MTTEAQNAATTGSEKAPEAPMQIHARVDSVDTRAHEILTKIREEQRAAEAEAPETPAGDAEAIEAATGSETAEEAETKGTPERGPDGKFLKAGEKKPDKAERAKPKEAPDADVERRERVARAAAIEREAVKARSRIAEEKARFDAQVAAFEAERRRVAEKAAELERLSEVFSGKDPLALLERISEHVPPDQMADYLLQAKDPAKRAEWAAKRAAKEAAGRKDPELEQLKAQIAEMRAEAQQMKVQKAQADAEAQFSGVAKSMADDAPHVAKLLERRPQQLIASANEVANYLAGTDPEWSHTDSSTRMRKIVEFIETDLSGFASVFAPQTSAGDQASTPASQAPVQKARTLTGRNSAGRSSLLDEDASAKMTLDERAEHLKRLARRST